MGLRDLFQKRESLVAVDIGSTSVKVLEIDDSEDRPRVTMAGFSDLVESPFSNYLISKPEGVAEKIAELLESSGITGKRAAIAVPGPSVFTKRIKMAKVKAADLRSTLELEAGNFIPHNINAVSLDYHVIGATDKNQLDVLVVAVKDEIIDSYTDCLALAGLETAVVDVDYFALQNAFELSHPDMLSKTVALVNIGARYSSISICRGGECLFTGDIGVGGKMLSDALIDGLGITYLESEKIKKAASEGKADDRAAELIDKNVEYSASEFNR